MIKDWAMKALMAILEYILDDELILELKQKFIAWLEEKAADSETTIDDYMVEVVRKLLGL